MVVSLRETIRPVSLPVACFHACRTSAVPSVFFWAAVVVVVVLVVVVCSGFSIFMVFSLRQKMPVVPPILVLNYTLPSSPQQLKQEVEARNGSGARQRTS